MEKVYIIYKKGLFHFYEDVFAVCTSFQEAKNIVLKNVIQNKNILLNKEYKTKEDDLEVLVIIETETNKKLQQ